MDIIRFLKIEKFKQFCILNELCEKYGDYPPYHKEVLEQRTRYFYICKLYRDAVAEKL